MVFFPAKVYPKDISESEIKSAIEKNFIFNGGGIGIIDIRGMKILCSVGVAFIDEKSPKQVLNGIRRSKLQSEYRYSRFVNGEMVSVSEILLMRSNVGTDNSENRNILDDLTQVQRAYSSSSLPPVDVISGWIVGDKLKVIYIIYSVI